MPRITDELQKWSKAYDWTYDQLLKCKQKDPFYNTFVLYMAYLVISGARTFGLNTKTGTDFLDDKNVVEYLKNMFVCIHSKMVQSNIFDLSFGKVHVIYLREWYNNFQITRGYPDMYFCDCCKHGVRHIPKTGSLKYYIREELEQMGWKESDLNKIYCPECLEINFKDDPLAFLS